MSSLHVQNHTCHEKNHRSKQHTHDKLSEVSFYESTEMKATYTTCENDASRPAKKRLDTSFETSERSGVENMYGVLYDTNGGWSGSRMPFGLCRSNGQPAYATRSQKSSGSCGV